MFNKTLLYARKVAPLNKKIDAKKKKTTKNLNKLNEKILKDKCSTFTEQQKEKNKKLITSSKKHNKTNQ